VIWLLSATCPLLRNDPLRRKTLLLDRQNPLALLQTGFCRNTNLPTGPVLARPLNGGSLEFAKGSQILRRSKVRVLHGQAQNYWKYRREWLGSSSPSEIPNAVIQTSGCENSGLWPRFSDRYQGEGTRPSPVLPVLRDSVYDCCLRTQGWLQREAGLSKPAGSAYQQ
jgi:hypothetical protein